MSRFEDLARHVDRVAPPLSDDSRARQRSRLVEALSDRPSKQRFWVLVPALGALLVAVAGYAHWRHGEVSERDAAEAWWVRVPKDTTQVVPERGELELVKQTSAHLERSGHVVRIVLDRGEVRSHVIPHRGTQWAVQVGAYSVEAVGTRFNVSYEPSEQQLDVTVQEGTVRVSGGQLGSSKVALEPGQSLTVRGAQVGIDRDVAGLNDHPVNQPHWGTEAEAEPTPGEPAVRDELAPVPSVDGAEAPVPTAAGEPAPLRSNTADANPRLTQSSNGPRAGAPPSAGPTRSDAATERPQSWLELERAGQHRQALDQAIELGFDRLVGSLGCADLALLADAARLSRDAARAEQALSAIQRRCAGSAVAARASFLLGRLEEEQAPSAAVTRYQEYLAGGAKEFAEQALGRLIAAEQRLGRTEEAKMAAQRYLKLYPNGSYESMARALASP